MVEKNREIIQQMVRNLNNLETDDELVPKLSQIIFEKITIFFLKKNNKIRQNNKIDFKWIAGLLYYPKNRFYVPIDKILKFKILRNFHDNHSAKWVTIQR